MCTCAVVSLLGNPCDPCYTNIVQGLQDSSGVQSTAASPYASALVILGLSTHDQLTGSALPNLVLDVTVNSTDIMKVRTTCHSNQENIEVCQQSFPSLIHATTDL